MGCKEKLIDFDSYIINENGSIFSKHLNKETKNALNAYGYVVNTYKHKDGKLLPHFRHRVVWYYFNGEIPDNMEIDHIDGNKQNNSLSNLRCVSSKENMRNPSTYPKLLEALRSDERKNKISKANIGKIVSEEQKIKQSLAMSGEKHPFWGKKRPKHSEIMKKALRDKNGRFIKKNG